MRIARAASAWSIPFPRLSDDPLEQFLIAEAVMARFESEQHATDEREQAREAARTRAQELLDARNR